MRISRENLSLVNPRINLHNLIEPSRKELNRQRQATLGVAFKNDEGVIGGGSGKTNSKVQELVGKLLDETLALSVRQSAAKEIGRIREIQAKEDFIALIRALDSKDYFVKGTIPLVLFKNSESAIKDVDVALLRQDLLSEDPYTCSYAAWVLGNLKSDAKETVPDLIKVLSRDKGPRDHAIWALGRIGPEASEAIPYLKEFLTNEDDGTKIATLTALGNMKEKAKELSLEIKEILLKDRNSNVRYYAAQALGEIKPSKDEIINALIETLKQDQSAVQNGAIDALGKMGSNAKKAVPDLIKALDNNELRTNAIYALGHIGEEAKDAVPALVKISNNEENTGHAAIFYALGNIGPAAKDAVPTLMSFVSKPRKDAKDEFDFVHAVEALAKIQGKCIHHMHEEIDKKNKKPGFLSWLFGF